MAITLCRCITPAARDSRGNGAGPDGVVHGLRTPKFDFNDETILLGAAWWVRIVEQELSLHA